MEKLASSSVRFRGYSSTTPAYYPLWSPESSRYPPRPIYHQLEHRVEAHILIAFLAYCLTATLKHRLQVHAPGLTPRSVLEKLATIQALDVWLPTTDGRHLVMPRYTEPEADLALLLHKLKFVLPKQPGPRLVSAPIMAVPLKM